MALDHLKEKKGYSGGKSPYPTPTKRDLQEIVALIKKHDGRYELARKELGISASRFNRYMELAKKKGISLPKKKTMSEIARDSWGYAEEDLRETWNLYERNGYNYKAAGEASGQDESTLRRKIKEGIHRFGFSQKPLGVPSARSAQRLALPPKGRIQRYILTTIQNNTSPHEPTLATLRQLSSYWDAPIKVATFTYTPQDGGSAKRGKDKSGLGWKLADRWYAETIKSNISDDFEQLAPGLVWCGHWNTLPTAVDPLSGTENLNGRNSGVFPHVRMEMRPVATTQGEATKFNWTTGTIGLRNYVAKRAGLVAEFYHCYGALLVEVDAHGSWWCRHLNADSEGTIYDLGIYATPKGVFENEDGVEALVFGDTHKSEIDPGIETATWAPGGMTDQLRAKKHVHHDIFSMLNSHHNRRDPHVMYALKKKGGDIVWDELKDTGQFIDWQARPWAETIIVDSNHDRHLDRYLKEVDWRQDLHNARTILAMNLAMIEHIDEHGDLDEFVALEWALKKMGHATKARFMNLSSANPDKLSLVVCKGNSGGIELAHHGDHGPNGARGSPRNLSKLGRKNVIGHGHSPGIWGGTYVAGTSSKLRMGYNIGASSWAHAHVVIYPNGKRQVLLFWDDKPWAEFEMAA